MENVDSLKVCLVFIGPWEGLDSPLQKIPFESQEATWAISCSWGSSFSRKNAGAWASTVPDPAPGRSLRLRKWEESESDQTVWPRHRSWWKVTFHMNLCLLERAESKAEDEVADVQRRPLEASDYRGVKLTYSLWLRGEDFQFTQNSKNKKRGRQINHLQLSFWDRRLLPTHIWTFSRCVAASEWDQCTDHSSPLWHTLRELRRLLLVTGRVPTLQQRWLNCATQF